MTARLATATLTFLMLAAAPALADEPLCGAFTLTGGDKGINVVDNPPAGKSPGDIRAGWRVLSDAGGKVVGKVHYVATLTEPAGPGHGDMLAGQYFIALPDGWIASQTLYELPDAADTSRRAGNAVLLVTGGTGSYAGAEGKIEIQPGESPRYVFEINCP